MASGTKRMASFSVGYFRAYSGWLLRHRRTVAPRVSTLNAEIDRIGEIQIEYRSHANGDGRKTEEMVGITVTTGSNLEHLLQAYIANGGNPLAISSFMYPQSSTVTVDGNQEATVTEIFPNSGVVFPASADPNDPLPSSIDTGYGMYQGGTLSTHEYHPSRQGSRASSGSYDHGALVKTMHQLRHWANQDIKEMLSELEARIIKQCDLREQLVHERDEVLVQAFGGVLNGVHDINQQRFDTNLMVQNLYQDVANTIFEKGPDGTTVVPRHPTDTFFQFTFPTVAPEVPNSM